MEVYVLDSLLRRTEVVDRFESMIWTERFREIGDFELHIQSTAANRRRFTAGTRLAITESKRVMVVETVENATDDENRRMLKVTGRSLEMILEDRAAIATYAGYNPMVEWAITDTPENVARTMFRDICVNGLLHPNDVIPFIMLEQNSYPADNIPEHAVAITWTQKPADLYSAIKDVCDIYDLGFRLYRNGDTSQLFFNIYTGSDRTTQQNALPPVIFSPELNNLLNTTELTTTAKTKNVAYVMATRQEDVEVDPANPAAGTQKQDVVYREVVYPPDVDPTVQGFERRVLFVSGEIPQSAMDNIPATPEEISVALQRQGQDELAKNRAFTAFDGEISQRAQYQYEVDYFLGDLVSMQNSDGYVNDMRVTEQIFVSDNEGDRAYPTLAVNLFITPGSWQSWGFQAWEDVELTEYWSNQP